VPLTVQHEPLAGVPALLVSDGPPAEAARRGAVLVLHGLGGHKGIQEPELHVLARAGLLAVGLDCVGHGDRAWPDLQARFDAGGEVAARAFREVVGGTVAEVPAVVDALLARGWGQAGRVGLAGISLGGFVAYGAALRERRLGAVVPIIGSPDWTGAGGAEAAGSPHLAPERFFPVALLSVTAARDEVVPPAAVHRLHAALGPRYAAAPERLRHLEWSGSQHLMLQEDWDATWREACAWFGRFLGADQAGGAEPLDSPPRAALRSAP
jgi:dienelactone hydrolase